MNEFKLAWGKLWINMKSIFVFSLIGTHSMKCWTVIQGIELKEKEEGVEDENHIGKPFRKYTKIKSVY